MIFFHEWSNCCFVRQGLIGEPRGSLLNESNVFYGLFRSSYFKFSRIMELSVQLGSAKTLEKYSTTARPVHLTSEQIETLQSFDPNFSIPLLLKVDIVGLSRRLLNPHYRNCFLDVFLPIKVVKIKLTTF